jgi:hypothetical protein
MELADAGRYDIPVEPITACPAREGRRQRECRGSRPAGSDKGRGAGRIGPTASRGSEGRHVPLSTG